MTPTTLGLKTTAMFLLSNRDSLYQCSVGLDEMYHIRNSRKIGTASIDAVRRYIESQG